MTTIIITEVVSSSEVIDMADQFLNGQYEVANDADGEVELVTWDEPDQVEALTDSLIQLGYMVEVSQDA